MEPARLFRQEQGARREFGIHDPRAFLNERNQLEIVIGERGRLPIELGKIEDVIQHGT